MENTHTSTIIYLLLLMLATFGIGWLISKLFFKGDSVDYSAQITDKEAELEACKKSTAEAKNAQSLAAKAVSTGGAAIASVSSIAAEPKAAVTIDTNKKDDLKIVEGIGPKIEQHLNNAGIKTFSQLANSPLNVIQGILDAAGPNYKVHDPGTWPAQSKLADEGKWDELKKWQDELNAGK